MGVGVLQDYERVIEFVVLVLLDEDVHGQLWGNRRGVFKDLGLELVFELDALFDHFLHIFGHALMVFFRSRGGGHFI